MLDLGCMCAECGLMLVYSCIVTTTSGNTTGNHQNFTIESGKESNPTCHQVTPMGRCTAKGKVQAQSHARQRQVQAPSEDPGEKLS